MEIAPFAACGGGDTIAALLLLGNEMRMVTALRAVRTRVTYGIE
jgi:hypothetical protein